MKQWKTALIAASPAFLLLLFLVILAMVFCYSRRWLFLHGRGNNEMGNRGGSRNHGNRGVVSINVGMKKQQQKKKKQKQKQKQTKKPFVWSENPTLIVEAVERGWVAFAFTYHNPSSSRSPSPSPSPSPSICPLSLSTSRGSLHHQQYKNKDKDKEEVKEEEKDGFEPEMSWEVGCGAVAEAEADSSSSVEYMQRLWLNPCATRLHLQVLQACLPLPGPPCSMGSSSSSSSAAAAAVASFPQQAYFELTIVPPPLVQPPPLHQTTPIQPHQPVVPLCEQSLLLNHDDVALTMSSPLTTMIHDTGSAKLNEMHERRSRSESRTSQDMGGVMQNLPTNNNNNNNNNNNTRNININININKNAVTINHHSSSRKFSVKDAIPHVEDDPPQILAIGLAPVGSPPSTLPGSDPGSVGVHSNGFVYLSGAPKLPAIKPLWNVVNTTIGCGFDPTSKNVFFTLNGELVYEFSALGTEFGHPLFPTVAANYDVTLLVNFGQCSFSYAHANRHRIADPGFRQRSTKNVVMIEDSGDLFSMGRIDSRWFEVRFPSMGGSHPLGLDAADSDLFEIVLDNSRRRR